MTHASLSREAREPAGITDILIRLGVDSEDTEDIVQDLRAALDSSGRHATAVGEAESERELQAARLGAVFSARHHRVAHTLRRRVR